jgi:hypothetical protein
MIPFLPGVLASPFVEYRNQGYPQCSLTRLENIFRINHTRLMKHGSSQGIVYQGTRPHQSPASGKDSSSGRIHASPEGLLKEWAHPRLARSLAQASFVVQRPRPNCLACTFNAGIA